MVDSYARMLDLCRPQCSGCSVARKERPAWLSVLNSSVVGGARGRCKTEALPEGLKKRSALRGQRAMAPVDVASAAILSLYYYRRRPRILPLPVVQLSASWMP